MNLTANQRLLVSETFEQAIMQSARLSDLFYQRFFELEPNVKPLFKSELTEQGFKFIQMISTILNALERPERFLETVQDLGVRHQEYGVQIHHYAVAGEALLWALEQILDDGFDETVREAWQTAYQVIMETAIQALSE